MKKLSHFAWAGSVALGLALGLGGWSLSDAFAQDIAKTWEKNAQPWSDKERKNIEDTVRRYTTPPSNPEIAKQAEKERKRLLKKIEKEFYHMDSATYP